jgi:hypothetical protein
MPVRWTGEDWSELLLLYESVRLQSTEIAVRVKLGA